MNLLSLVLLFAGVLRLVPVREGPTRPELSQKDRQEEADCQRLFREWP